MNYKNTGLGNCQIPTGILLWKTQAWEMVKSQVGFPYWNFFQVCKMAKKTLTIRFNSLLKENPKAKLFLLKTHPENALFPGLGF